MNENGAAFGITRLIKTSRPKSKFVCLQVIAGQSRKVNLPGTSQWRDHHQHKNETFPFPIKLSILQDK